MDKQVHHDDLLEITDFDVLKSKLIGISTRGKLEEQKRGNRINAVSSDDNKGMMGAPFAPPVPIVVLAPRSAAAAQRHPDPPIPPAVPP